MEKGMFTKYAYIVLDRLLIFIDIKIKAHEELKLNQQILDNSSKKRIKIKFDSSLSLIYNGTILNKR